MDNAATATSGQKKKQCQNGQWGSQGPKKDILKITCYNYNKKGHLAQYYTEPKNLL